MQGGCAQKIGRCDKLRSDIERLFNCPDSISSGAIKHYCFSGRCCSSRWHCCQQIVETCRELFWSNQPPPLALSKWNSLSATCAWWDAAISLYSLVPRAWLRAFRDNPPPSMDVINATMAEGPGDNSFQRENSKRQRTFACFTISLCVLPGSCV